MSVRICADILSSMFRSRPEACRILSFSDLIIDLCRISATNTAYLTNLRPNNKTFCHEASVPKQQTSSGMWNTPSTSRRNSIHEKTLDRLTTPNTFGGPSVVCDLFSRRSRYTGWCCFVSFCHPRNRLLHQNNISSSCHKPDRHSRWAQE